MFMVLILCACVNFLFFFLCNVLFYLGISFFSPVTFLSVFIPCFEILKLLSSCLLFKLFIIFCFLTVTFKVFMFLISFVLMRYLMI